MAKQTVRGLNRVLPNRRSHDPNPVILDSLGLDQYFDSVLYGGVYSTIPEHTIMFGSEIRLHYKTVDVLNIDGVGIPDLHFYVNRLYWAGAHTIVSSTPAHEVVELRLNDRFLGFAIPGIGSLLLSTGPAGATYVGDTNVAVWNRVWEKLQERFQFPVRNPARARKTASGRKPIPITIGADPEFEIHDDSGAVLSARNVMDDDDDQFGEVGRDGAGAQVELRPKPGKTPSEFVRNLRSTFQKFNSWYDEYHLGVKGHIYPLGGHIHAGVGQPLYMPADMVQALDAFIGSPTLGLSGRAREGYRQLGAVRHQPHGFEYRTPPAAIFVRPAITRIVAKIFQNLMDKYVNSEGFSYNNPPTEKDYMDVAGITQFEYKKFRRFCETYNDKVNTDRGYTLATAFWAGKKPPAKKRVKNGASRIAIRDVWDTTIQNDFKAVIVPLFKEYGHDDYNIVFYGYREDRGLVSNATVSGWGYVDAATGVGTPTMTIGLPHAFRNNIGEYNAYKAYVFRAIRALMRLQQEDLARRRI